MSTEKKPPPGHLTGDHEGLRIAGRVILEPGEVVSKRVLRERVESAVEAWWEKRYPKRVVEVQEHVCEKGRIEIVTTRPKK